MKASFIRYGVIAAILASLLRFVSGHGDWVRAWIYVAITSGSQVVVGALLARRNPELLIERSRVRAGTKTWDKWLAALVALVGPLAMWTVAGWDVRNHWPPAVPVVWSSVAFATCVAAIGFTGWAMTVNRFFANTVRIQKERGHGVVDQGPYEYLRHPGYAGAAIFTIASPVALGSWRAEIPALLVVAVLVLRTALEDRTLSQELDGYAAYSMRVTSRLIPGVW